ncbi:DUF3231 family protein [Litchfieldia alkalitelluris]|uniref:DUF3231 family protein n=1 Tax=Litchfieldia alkalitelluris TaxID=304268 RepID=UPI0009973CCF|nr:DUF3231 family protein [Litchfieldia alkalitelluris]
MDKSKILLTATEMGFLWSSYQFESMNVTLLTYFQSIVEDPEIKRLVDYTFELCNKHESTLEQLFADNEFAKPMGFSKDDVNLHAKKLYTDEFILMFTWFIGKGNLNFSAMALNSVAREDVSKYYEECISDGTQVVSKTRTLLLEKGLWVRAPYIPVPTEKEIVHKQSFLNGWFGEKRPLLGVEIANLFYNIITNTIGISLTSSFIQVTKSDEIKQYFQRGKDISEKHVKVLSDVLRSENLPGPSFWNFGVTDSKEAPFSEEFMLNLITLLNSQGISNYGVSLSTTMRKDIGAHFIRLTDEVLLYSEDGANLLIEKGWMEQPPKAPKRE